MKFYYQVLQYDFPLYGYGSRTEAEKLAKALNKAHKKAFRRARAPFKAKKVKFFTFKEGKQ